MESQKGSPASQDNKETRFIHIQDPSTYDKGQPIDDAVTTAFDDANVKDIAGISPELIAQITHNVIQQLKTTGVPETAQTPVTAIPPVNQPRPETPDSPSTRSRTPPPRIFTPPSPQKQSETQGVYSDGLSRGSASPTTKHRSNSSTSAAEDRAARPRPPVREPTVEEATTLEKIWGKLFDEDGKATARLGQFLRGLATHLIEDTEPKQSLVITPMKMVSFYESTKITGDAYPWHVIFDDMRSSISRMYRELRIQHHLVQDEDEFNIKPSIPGLTAKGFERWQTLMIQAHPEEEFERLRVAIQNMPINNPDEKTERFPKDISRRLFPKKENLDIRDQLIDAMEVHAKVDLSRDDDVSTPRSEIPLPRRESDEASHESFTDGSTASDARYPRGSIERQRKPYTKIPPDSAIDDLKPKISTPIERERKPYSAGPGGGKMYDDQEGAPLSHSVSSSAVPPPSSSLGGSNIGLSRSASNSSRPISIPPPPKGQSVHRMSASEYGSPLYNFHGAPHLRDPAGSRRRNQSPLGNDLRRSETDIRGFQSSSYDPPSYMSRDGFPPPPPPQQSQYMQGDSRYDDDRRYPRESDLRRENYARGGSPSRRVNSSNLPPPPDEDFYRRREQQSWGRQ